MILTLVTPRQGTEHEKNIYDYRYVSRFIFSRAYSGYLLAIPTLAALTPPDVEVKVADENIAPIDFTSPTDLVAISVRTMFAKRAYQIASRFRERGVKVVLGGIHPSMLPEEAGQYADSIVVGEAEDIWHELIQDFKNNNLKKVYKAASRPDLSECPRPDRRFLENNKYLLHIVQTTKGCPFFCEFCSVHAFDGTAIRHRPIEQVINDIKETQRDGIYERKRAIFFADDNLRQMNKRINLTQDFSKAIQKIQSNRILVQGSFIVGHDNDTKETFQKLADFINKNNLLFALVSILTPFPGTGLFHRMEKESRLLYKDWEKYDSKTVVFKPKHLTPLELKNGFIHVNREVYSFKSIYKKLRHFWEIDFWKEQNRRNPIKFKYRILFTFRLMTYLFTWDFERVKFIFKILPWVFDKRVRISTIITLMAYNDYAYSLKYS